MAVHSPTSAPMPHSSVRARRNWIVAPPYPVQQRLRGVGIALCNELLSVCDPFRILGGVFHLRFLRMSNQLNIPHTNSHDLVCVPVTYGQLPAHYALGL
ncbi:hypothetical protein J6590_094337 [Homalodisca vitripennis]|nr:hypothetical protein J6590_094337 [Homalodisca vitripennis]